MPLDANGIWQYTGPELAAPVPALLNRLAASVSTQIAALRNRTIPAAMIALAAAQVQAVPAAPLAFPLQTVVRATAGMQDGTTGTVIAPVDGWYAVHGHAYLAYATTPPTRVRIEVRVNGSADNAANLMADFAASATITNFAVSSPVWLPAGARLGLWLSQTGGVGVSPLASNSTAQGTFLRVAYLGRDT